MKRDNEEMTLPAAKASRCLSPPNAFHTSAANGTEQENMASFRPWS